MGTDRQLEALARELLEKMSYLTEHMTTTSEKLATGVVNNVLDTGTKYFKSDGSLPLSYAATIGSIEVANFTSATVYVTPGPNSGVPQGDTSMSRVEPGLCRVINVANRNVTLYGTVGGAVGVQVFTKGGLVNTNIMAVDGGTP